MKSGDPERALAACAGAASSRPRREALPRPLPQAGGENKGRPFPPGREGREGAARFSSPTRGGCTRPPPPLAAAHSSSSPLAAAALFLLPRLRGRPGGGPAACAGAASSRLRREALPRPLPQAGGENKGRPFPPGREGREGAARSPSPSPACGGCTLSPPPLAGEAGRGSGGVCRRGKPLPRREGRTGALTASCRRPGHSERRTPARAAPLEPVRRRPRLPCARLPGRLLRPGPGRRRRGGSGARPPR